MVAGKDCACEAWMFVAGRGEFDVSLLWCQSSTAREEVPGRLDRTSIDWGGAGAEVARDALLRDRSALEADIGIRKWSKAEVGLVSEHNVFWCLRV